MYSWGVCFTWFDCNYLPISWTNVCLPLRFKKPGFQWITLARTYKIKNSMNTCSLTATKVYQRGMDFRHKGIIMENTYIFFQRGRAEVIVLKRNITCMFSAQYFDKWQSILFPFPFLCLELPFQVVDGTHHFVELFQSCPEKSLFVYIGPEKPQWGVANYVYIFTSLPNQTH